MRPFHLQLHPRHSCSYDFCYWANAALLLYLWVLPHNATLFQICFMAANGPLVRSSLQSRLTPHTEPPSLCLHAAQGVVYPCFQPSSRSASMAASRQRVHSRGAHDSHLRLEMVLLSHLFRSPLLPFNPSLCLRLTSERFLRSRLLRYPSSFAVCINFPLCSDTSHLSLLGNALSRSNKFLAASLCAAFDAVLTI